MRSAPRTCTTYFSGRCAITWPSRGPRLPVDVVAEYHASALTGVLGWWVRADFPHGPAEMARMCREMTQPGVMAALRGIHAEGPR